MPLTKNEESSTLNPKSTAKNLEFKIVLDNLRRSEVYINHDYHRRLNCAKGIVYVVTKNKVK